MMAAKELSFTLWCQAGATSGWDVERPLGATKQKVGLYFWSHDGFPWKDELAKCLGWCWTPNSVSLFAGFPLFGSATRSAANPPKSNLRIAKLLVGQIGIPWCQSLLLTFLGCLGLDFQEGPRIHFWSFLMDFCFFGGVFVNFQHSGNLPPRN